MDPSVRKRILRTLSNGMYVVTTGAGAEITGATITWLTQSSFKPPLLVAAVRAGSSLWDGIQRTQRAVVHVLAADQEEIAKAFFTPVSVEGETINGLGYEALAAGPRLLDAHAWAACEVRQIVECGGDHELVVMEVVGVGGSNDFEPLTVRASPWEYGG